MRRPTHLRVRHQHHYHGATASLLTHLRTYALTHLRTHALTHSVVAGIHRGLDAVAHPGLHAADEVRKALLQGLAVRNFPILLAGAVPVAVLAMIAEIVLGGVRRLVVPKGLTV